MSTPAQMGSLGCAKCVKILKLQDTQWNSHILDLVNARFTKILKKKLILQGPRQRLKFYTMSLNFYITSK